jgi:hypothetical protein
MYSNPARRHAAILKDANEPMMPSPIPLNREHITSRTPGSVKS